MLTGPHRKGVLYFYKRTLLATQFSVGHGNATKFKKDPSSPDDGSSNLGSYTSLRASMLSIERHNVIRDLTFDMNVMCNHSPPPVSYHTISG